MESTDDMPRRKSRKSKKGGKLRRRWLGRRHKKSAGRGKASSLVLKNPTAFPDRVYVKLKYADVYLLTFTSGVPVAQVMRGNSLLDPDRTGTGHQPYAFDQWKTLYNQYRVHASSISIRALVDSTSSVNAYSQWLSVYPAHNYTSPVTSTGYGAEIPYNKTRVFNIYQTSSNTAIKHYMSTAKIYGVDKQAVRDNDNFSAVYNANPVNEWDWIISASTIDLATTSTQYLFITVNYYTEFFDRFTLGQS